MASPTIAGTGRTFLWIEKELRMAAFVPLFATISGLASAQEVTKKTAKKRWSFSPNRQCCNTESLK